MEYWLIDFDFLVRVEFCFNGYKILDYIRLDCCGGGIGIIYYELLDVKKIDVGVSL